MLKIRTETFSNFNLELITIGVTGLLLANFLSGTTEGMSLVHDGLRILKDMSLRGNLPASSALALLDGLSKLVLESSTGRNTQHDACDLGLQAESWKVSGNGILDGELLEIFPSTQAPQELSPAGDTTMVVAAPSEGGNPTTGGGVSLGDLWQGEDFTFDEGDLQWLDTVQ